jgi:hypothetical protein
MLSRVVDQIDMRVVSRGNIGDENLGPVRFDANCREEILMRRNVSREKRIDLIAIVCGVEDHRREHQSDHSVGAWLGANVLQ